MKKLDWYLCPRGPQCNRQKLGKIRVCVSLIECGRECVCVYVDICDTFAASTLVIATGTKVQIKTSLKNDKLFC